MFVAEGVFVGIAAIVCSRDNSSLFSNSAVAKTIVSVILIVLAYASVASSDSDSGALVSEADESQDISIKTSSKIILLGKYFIIVSSSLVF